MNEFQQKLTEIYDVIRRILTRNRPVNVDAKPLESEIEAVVRKAIEAAVAERDSVQTTMADAVAKTLREQGVTDIDGVQSIIKLLTKTAVADDDYHAELVKRTGAAACNDAAISLAQKGDPKAVLEALAKELGVKLA